MSEDSPIDTEMTTNFLTQAAPRGRLLPQLVAHLREHRSKLRQEWAGRIQDAPAACDDSPGDGGGDQVGVRQLC